MTVIWSMVPELWSVADTTFLSFWAIFCPFTPLTTQKNQNSGKMEKCLEIWPFYTSVPKILIICYTVHKIQRVTDKNFIFHFGLFFAQPNSPMNKMPSSTRYHHFTHEHQRLWSDDTSTCKCTVPEVWCVADRQTNRLKNWHLEVGVPPKNWKLFNSFIGFNINYQWSRNNKPKGHLLMYII